MKVAVSSQGPDLGSPVELCFGRAPCFVIVDTQSGELSLCNNFESIHTAHTAGMQAAGTLISLGATVVITNKIGPKAFGTFQAVKVKVYTTTSPTVTEAVEQFKAGSLQQLRRANAKEHSNQTIKEDIHATR
ncbi:MAG: NifB/NifX family molybdenum-iron cluster-binding protein [Pirellulales bacterium]|nr:NifB/NifX family molybdenum-iron cluster-binding protein [Pirellulales bacterium]